jgi:hypothetical protein
MSLKRILKLWTFSLPMGFLAIIRWLYFYIICSDHDGHSSSQAQSNRTKWTWTETSKTMSQKSLLLLNWLSQVVLQYWWKMTNTYGNSLKVVAVSQWD